MHKNLFLFFALALTLSACEAETSTTETSEAEKTVAEPARPDCISSFTAIQDSLATVRNRTSERHALSHAIRVYTVEISKLDLKDCPDSFRAAVKAHRNAWRDLLPITDQHPDLRGNMLTLLDKLAQTEQGEELNAAMNDVWATLEILEKWKTTEATPE